MGVSLALAAVVGVILLRRYEVSPPIYREAARSGNVSASGDIALYASPACGELASSYDQASAAVETYLLLAGMSHEKRLGSARKAPRGRVRAVTRCLNYFQADGKGLEGVWVRHVLPLASADQEEGRSKFAFEVAELQLLCASSHIWRTACWRYPSGG